MSRRLNEKQTTVNTGILDVSLALSRELLSQIRRVLIFDIFDNRVPASRISIFLAELNWKSLPSIIVDLVTVARGIYDIKP